jgi:Protein of unknown function (DUF2877)
MLFAKAGPDEVEAQRCNMLGRTPSPRRGEGWGEGVAAYREIVTPHPTPLPLGEGADLPRRVVHETQPSDQVAVGIPILRAGALARDFCRMHTRAEVAAVFERSVYLRRGETFVCLGGPSIGNGPLTMIVDFCPSGLRAGAPVSITERAISIGDRHLTLDRCELWRPSSRPAALEYDRLIEGCRAITKRMVVEAPAEGLARIHEPGRDGTALARIVRPRIARFESWLRHAFEPDQTAADSAHVAVWDLIGLGPGLTPSGDDFLAGALALLDALAKRKAHAALARAITTAPRGLTSPLSHCLLSAATHGHVGERLSLAVAAVVAGDVGAAIAAIRTIGHSSGWDMLVGATAALRVVAGAKGASS